MPKTLRVFHRTEYRYDRDVSFGPHRLLLRPLGGHDLRVLDSSILVIPHAALNWHFDTFANSVAHANFQQDASKLVIESKLLIRRYASVPISPLDPMSNTADTSTDEPEDAMVLAPFMQLQNPEDIEDLRTWLSAHNRNHLTNGLELLRSLSDDIHHSFRYSRRDTLGTHSVTTTIRLRRGTCRDFAFFFMEAARVLGFAARFVTGYLYDPVDDDESDGNGSSESLSGGGSTHAWADAFIPGLGWVEFDPTNRVVAGIGLIRVATTRTPAQASPIQGTYIGGDAVFLGMDVAVKVTSAEPGATHI